MAWTKPAATEMRFGFEVTMYVMNKQLQLFSKPMENSQFNAERI